jgi:hypothetical protein
MLNWPPKIDNVPTREVADELLEVPIPAPSIAVMSIVFKSLSANEDSSIHCNFEFDSNVTDVSNVHLSKQNSRTTSTDAGISIVLKAHPSNADASIRCNFEFDSNVTNASNVHS